MLRRVGELVAGRRPTVNSQQAREDRPDPADPNLKREREALKLALQAPVFAGPVFDAVDESAYTHPKYAALRVAVAAAGGASAGVAGPAWVEKVASACIDEVARGLAAELAVEPLLRDEEPDVHYAAEMLSRLQEMAVTRQVVELKSRLQRVNPVEAPAKHTKLFGELIALEQYRIALREKGIQGL